MKTLITLFGLAAALAAQTTINGSRTILGAWDASGATRTAPFKVGTASALPATCTVGDYYFESDGVPGRKLMSCTATNTWIPIVYDQGTSTPATCTTGQMYFKTDATAGQNLYFCTATNTWTQMTGSGGSISSGNGIGVSGSTVSVNPFETGSLILNDYFCSGGTSSSNNILGSLGWKVANIVGSSNLLNTATADTNHLCGVLLKSDAVTTHGVAIATLIANNPLPSEIWRSAGFRPTEVQFQAAISSTSNIRAFLGIRKNATIAPGSNDVGCFFRYDTTASDTGWMAQCGDASSMSTAVAVTGTLDTSIHRFRMWTTAAGTFNFSIDGGATATVTMTMPTGQTIAPSAAIINDSVSTASALSVYRFGLVITGLSVN